MHINIYIIKNVRRRIKFCMVYTIWLYELYRDCGRNKAIATALSNQKMPNIHMSEFHPLELHYNVCTEP